MLLFSFFVFFSSFLSVTWRWAILCSFIWCVRPKNGVRFEANVCAVRLMPSQQRFHRYFLVSSSLFFFLISISQGDTLHHLTIAIATVAFCFGLCHFSRHNGQIALPEMAFRRNGFQIKFLFMNRT